MILISSVLIPTNKSEKIGEIFIFIHVVIMGVFPIVAKSAIQIIEPILFAGISTFLAALILLIYIIISRNSKEIFNKKIIPLSAGVTIFIVVIPSILIFIGATMTSSINIAILAQTELVFTWIIFGIFMKETITANKILGSLFVSLGAITVLYNGSFKMNLGDIFIILGHLSFPIGNIFAKKALLISNSSTILFHRYFFGGLFLLLISFFFETPALPSSFQLQKILLLLIVNGILINVVSKLFAYESFKRLEVTKAISIAIASPGFSFIYAYIFLKEIPTLYQTLGFAIIITGLLIITKNNKQTSPVHVAV